MPEQPPGAGEDAMELPPHPETDEAPALHDPAAGFNWAFVAVVAVIGVLMALMVILHLTGVVGPGAH